MKNKILNLLHLFSTILVVAKLGGVVGQSNTRCAERERRALLQFKDELVDDYGRLSSWGVGNYKRECCKWRGVRCHNRTNHVTHLNLGGGLSMLVLKVKVSSSLLELKHLTYLDLSYNDFDSSNFLQFIGSFEKLRYLNLSNVGLSGRIPQSIGNLSNLMYLDFRRNAGLYSDDLDWLSPLASLEYLDLSDVKLGNASNWLQAISKLASIKQLHLGSCQLQGVHSSSLPFINFSAPLAILDLSDNLVVSSSMYQWFLNFSKSLTSIDLSDNNLTHLLSADSLDDQIFLEHLDLSDNMISGLLPNFSKFPFLNHLDLRRNKLNGPIANGFLNIPHLIHLDLSSNNFTGTIPDLTTSLFLERLYLKYNTLGGYLGESIGCMSMMVELVLGSNNLEGMITEKHLFNLSRLQILDLSSNSLLTVNCSPHWVPPFQLKAMSLSGCKIGPRFPQWLQFQRRLEFLDISSSQIADTFPHGFGKSTSRLLHLNASNNDIHGILPESFFKLTSQSTGAVELDLARNKIRGQVTFLCHNDAWGFIDLSDNLFSGHVPSCVTDSTRLMFLNLANNHFVGEIPDSIGSLKRLVSLNLRNNSLSGGIPESLSYCESLQSIELGENMLTGNIPTWIGDNLSQLIVLSLSLNGFNGTIPGSICRIQNIQVLDLSSNMISGSIPKCLHNITTMTREGFAFQTFFGFNFSYAEDFNCSAYYSLRDGAYIMWKGKEFKYVKGLMLVKLIDLSDNLLVGDIPCEITKLDGLVMLNLSRNHLCGQIPQNISKLKHLNALDLSRNHLSGSIPMGISELSFLGVLDLSYNNLSGRIPYQFLSFDESAYAGNPWLCGHPILNKSCPGDDEIDHQDSNFNNDDDDWEDEDDKLITQGFYICMVFGFAIGFWGILGTILVSNSARFAYFKSLNAIGDFAYVRIELSKARFRNRFRN